MPAFVKVDETHVREAADGTVTTPMLNTGDW